MKCAYCSEQARYTVLVVESHDDYTKAFFCEKESCVRGFAEEHADVLRPRTFKEEHLCRWPSGAPDVPLLREALRELKNYQDVLLTKRALVSATVLGQLINRIRTAVTS